MLDFICNRRELLKSSSGASLGIIFGFSLPLLSSEPGRAEMASATIQSLVTVYADSRVEIVIFKAEMGQGVINSLAMLMAEEMDADWAKIEVILRGEQPPYSDPKAGLAATFGSTSLRNQSARYRKIGAGLRSLIIEAARLRTQIAAELLRTEKSKVIDASGKVLFSFGDLIQDLERLPFPEQPQLKSKNQYALVGSNPPRKDTESKIQGSAVFGIDVRLPNMKYAAVRHHRVFGAQLENFNELLAAMPEDIELIETKDALIAIAASYWSAQRSLDRLPVRYLTTDAMNNNSQLSIENKLSAAVQNFDGSVVKSLKGGLDTYNSCETTLTAEYFVPFLAHGALEPLVCTASFSNGRCELWAPTQSAFLVSLAVSRALQIDPQSVKVHVTYLGGSFGRKVETDFCVQAAIAARSQQVPVQLIWSRQQDTQHDFFRPAYSARLSAGFNAGELVVVAGQNAGPAISRRANPSVAIDFTSIDGFSDQPYSWDQQAWLHREVDLGVPVGYWRSVGKSQNCFFIESFVDEIAYRQNVDPLQFRRQYLKENRRAQLILDRLFEVSQWQLTRTESALGMAFSEGFGSLAAMAVEVSLKNSKIEILRTWTVVDCGELIHPSGAEAQVMGAALYGLSAALYGKVTLSAGKVDQALFAERPFIKLSEAPQQKVYFLESEGSLGGLGEVATPLAAPALANAIFQLTGQRARRLPLQDFVWLKSE